MFVWKARSDLPGFGVIDTVHFVHLILLLPAVYLVIWFCTML